MIARIILVFGPAIAMGSPTQLSYAKFDCKARMNSVRNEFTSLIEVQVQISKNRAEIDQLRPQLQGSAATPFMGKKTKAKIIEMNSRLQTLLEDSERLIHKYRRAVTKLGLEAQYTKSYCPGLKLDVVPLLVASLTENRRLDGSLMLSIDAKEFEFGKTCKERLAEFTKIQKIVDVLKDNQSKLEDELVALAPKIEEAKKKSEYWEPISKWLFRFDVADGVVFVMSIRYPTFMKALGVVEFFDTLAFMAARRKWSTYAKAQTVGEVQSDEIRDDQTRLKDDIEIVQSVLNSLTSEEKQSCDR